MKNPVSWVAPLNVTNVSLVAALGSMTDAQKNVWIAKGGGLITATLFPTAAQLCTATSLPIPWAPAPGVGFVLIPVLFVMTQRLGVTIFGAARQYQPEWAGPLNTDPLSTIAMTNAANAYKRSFNSAMQNFSQSQVFENLGIVLNGVGGDTTGGSGSFRFDLVYAVAPVG